MVDFKIIMADANDHARLSSFLNFQTHIHRHLDWRSPLDWLGLQPFLLAVENGNVRALLACPPDPEDIYWIRIFASSNIVPPRTAWTALISEIIEMLPDKAHCRLVSLALQSWFVNSYLLKKSLSSNGMAGSRAPSRPCHLFLLER